MSQKNQEELLQAWIQMSACIRGNRILTDISMNEMVICGLLYESRQRGELLMAKELCRHTRLLKSQMNQILSDMEAAGGIERIRSDEDRRKVYICLKDERIRRYEAEHQRIMDILRAVERKLGEERTAELTALIREATQVVDQMQQTAVR